MVAKDFPQLFGRPGGTGRYIPGVWFGYMLLWFICDPLFPQLFQRFLAANRKRDIELTMLLYPAICTVTFLFPVALGVMGRLSNPDLASKTADKIIPLMLGEIAGPVLTTLVMTAALAALMSTMDSQLLTMASIFSRDIAPIFGLRKSPTGIGGRVFVVILALCGLALAYNPPGTILTIATHSFSGLAMLFPTVFFGLYLKNRYPSATILSIAIGEFILILDYLGFNITTQTLTVVPAFIASSFVYLSVHAFHIFRQGSLKFFWPSFLKNPFIYAFAVIFVLSNIIGLNIVSPKIIFGLPLWIWAFIGLSFIQTIVSFIWIRKRRSVAV
jgi:SSS family solute:Na+ symporter